MAAFFPVVGRFKAKQNKEKELTFDIVFETSSRIRRLRSAGNGVSVPASFFPSQLELTLYFSSTPDRVQPSGHAGTSNVPEGLQELSLMWLFRDFRCSFLLLPNTEGQGLFSLVTPTPTLAQPHFTISSARTKIDEMI